MNSCTNSLEDGPVGPKHVEIRQYTNKIEIVTSVGFYSINYVVFDGYYHIVIVPEHMGMTSIK